MLLIQCSITGRKHLGSIHIHNVGGTTQIGIYKVECWDSDGKLQWHAQVQHNCTEEWWVLVHKATLQASIPTPSLNTGSTKEEE